MPRVSDARQKLMEAALALIWTGGYAATSVDDICAKADVKKGSFYHFFKSKADLEVAALEMNWQRMRPDWDQIFSPSVPPLQRIENFLDFALRRQTRLQEEFGCVVGCPLCSVSSEVGLREVEIRDKALEIMGHYLKYFETAIRDAHAQGEIVAPDAKAKAQAFYSYFMGVVSHARISNSLEPLKGLKAGTWALLGVQEQVPAHA
jgi:TetR/AcrR family transcriptional repressor of nem operon